MKVPRILLPLEATGKPPMNMKDTRTLSSYDRDTRGYFKFTDAFPMTVTGKIQKFKMREISTKELALEEVATIKTA